MTGPNPTPLRASDVACDMTVLLLAVWTVVCQGVVHAGGRPAQLIAAFAVLCLAVGVASVVCVRRLGAAGLGAVLSDRASGLPGGPADTVPPLARGLLVVGGLSCLAFEPGAVAFWVATTLVMAAAVLLNRRLSTPAGPNTVAQERGVWALAFSLAILATCAHRPDRDDAFYLGAAASVLKYPELPLLSFDPIHGEGWPIQISVYRAHTVELLAGVLSSLSGIGVIHFMHVALPVVGAVLWTLALSRLLAELLPARWPLALACVVAIYALTADRHQGYANFGVVRLFQGKAVFVSAMVPLLFLYGMRLGRAPSLKRFGLLFAAQVASLGLTASALSVAPFVVAGGVLVGVADAPRKAATLLAGALSTVYLVGTGLYFFVTLDAGAAVGSAVSHTAEVATGPTALATTMLTRAYHMVLGDGAVSAILLAAVLVAPGLAMTASARRFASVLGLLFFGVVASPWLSELLLRGLFGKAAYWRIFWVLPLPLIAACAVASVGRWHVERAMAVTAFGAALFAASGAHVLAKSNGVEFGPPGNNARPQRWSVAKAIVDAAPAGSRVLAEDLVSQWIPAMGERVYPIFVKASYLRGDDDARRTRLGDCMLSRPHRICTTRYLRSELAHYAPAVVAVPNNRQRSRTLHALRAGGYRRTASVSGQQIWTRTGPVGHP